MPHIHVSHFVLTSFSDALVTFVINQVSTITTNVKHRFRTTGSEHQGQNSISDSDQNLGFTVLVFFHQVCKKILAHQIEYYAFFAVSQSLFC